MSHFTVGVILPVGGEDTTRQWLNRILEQYDESLQVAPYPKDCWCISRVAKKWASQKADALVGVHENLKLLESKQTWWEVREDYAQYHPEYGKADPNCGDCDGTGTYMSTYNPSSKWDWWTIGGRWDGCLPNGSNYMQCGEILANRKSRRPTIDPDLALYDYFRLEYESELAQYEATPEDLRDLYEPFALLTPDGKWHERGDMGWFGMVADDIGLYSWIKQVKAIYEQYAEHTLVLIDCHI